MSRLRDALERGEFVVTGEIAPPLGTDLAAMRQSIETIGPYCHAINITDNQGASLHLSSLAASRIALEMGYEPIFQQTCRDRNRLALQSDLLAAWTLGLENVLIVTGDDPRSGDHPQAKGVFDLDSTQLLEVASAMNAGTDMLGRPLKGSTDFFMGAAMFPEAEPWDIQLLRAERKVEAGARFFQTQAIFDLAKLERTVAVMRPLGVKVIAGVIVLRSARAVDFINNRLAGLMVPDDIVARIKGASDVAIEAVALATEQVRAIRDIADGVHIMTLGLDSAVPQILGANQEA
ncbi:MAG: methylenetetrahydrofolate reductase [Actinomycetota bacterium]|nr:MAG: methylenetetrahydrofolate [Actinomycetota bacterium]MDO8949242.1 methylenetetrahydrofolate reductase [Actinomycetota bacterium]MDP3631204.1 methylenetetrahydrofolate reductase [Actinomycetota bacterium]